MQPSCAVEKMILSICELEITSVLCSSALFVLVESNMADRQILPVTWVKQLVNA